MESLIKEFGLATLLVAKGCKLVSYTVDDLGQLWFEFESGPQMKDLTDGYYRNTVEVRIQDYLAAQKMLKALIYETKRTTYENKMGRFSTAPSKPIHSAN